jgi:hypothetical protein
MTRLTRTLCAIAAALVIAAPASVSARQLGGEQTTFASAQAAADGLAAAVKARDVAALMRIFGPDAEQLGSGDVAEDAAALERLAAAVEESFYVVESGATARLYVGADNWPFPVPLARGADGTWSFDTVAGRAEVADRRIGRNELAAMAVVAAIVDAQDEYASADRDVDGVLEYAQRFVSSVGARDGLYWETAEDEEPSPLGPLVGAAEGRPFFGYNFKLLTRQGPRAPGGAMDYVVDGNMTRGFAVLAFPAVWGETGRTTFVAGPDGVVLQKDLGAKTADAAAALSAFDPDATWTPAR